MAICAVEAFGGPGTLRVSASNADHQLWELVSEALSATAGITLAALAPEAYDNVAVLCVWYDTAALLGPVEVVRVISNVLRGVAARLLAVSAQVGVEAATE
jgi:hypothetical protein